MQDNYLEEAMKVRNLLEEFHGKHGLRPPTILGVREHVFTGRWVSVESGLNYISSDIVAKLLFIVFQLCSVSSLAWFMSNQETSFVTLGQRVLAKPLKLVSFNLDRSCCLKWYYFLRSSHYQTCLLLVDSCFGRF